jgi:ribosomal protein S18 acetylase RimI-like enzyme
MQTNFERLIQLAEETFSTRRDPSQITVNEAVMEQLRRIHPASLSEETNSEGPVAWMLVFPTTNDLMKLFVKREISELALLDRTPVDREYSAIYLCSALVLEESRRKGIARKLMCEAISSIARDHPIQSLFSWPFSEEGSMLANSVARTIGLPLIERTSQ